jgi:ATP-dependent Clp protease ATP-binding subunit ClpX
MSGAKRTSNAYCSFCRKSYRDVGPLVEGPGDVYICGECIELCQHIVDQEKRRRGSAKRASGPTAESLRGRLEPQPCIDAGARDHLIRIGLDHSNRLHGDPLGPVVLVGPAPSSRLFVAKALAHALEVPFAEGHASALVADPDNTEPLLLQLLQTAEFEVALAERGVVYVDGADNPVAQERLLQLPERTAVGSGLHRLEFDASRVLLLCGGEFAGLNASLSSTGLERELSQEVMADCGLVAALIRKRPFLVRVGPLDEPTVCRLVSGLNFDRISPTSAERSNR